MVKALYNQEMTYYNDGLWYDDTGRSRRVDRMQVLQREYNTASTINGCFLTIRGGADIAPSPNLVAGDVKVSKDGAAFVNIATLPQVSPEGMITIELIPDELICKRLVIKFVDQNAPKQWEDEVIIVDTYGNDNAQYPIDNAVIQDATNQIQTMATNIQTTVDTIEGKTSQIQFDEGLVKARIDTGIAPVVWDYFVYGDSDLTIPLPDVKVWLTSDPEGVVIVQPAKYTDSFGKTTWRLDPGFYYVWREKVGYGFDNPDIEEVK